MKIAFAVEEHWLNEVMTLVSACLVPAVLHGAWELAKSENRLPTGEDLARCRSDAIDEWLRTMTEIAGRCHVRPTDPAG